MGDLTKEIMEEMSTIRELVTNEDKVGPIYDDEGDDRIAALTLLVKAAMDLSLIHIPDPTTQPEIPFAAFCLKKKTTSNGNSS